MESKSEWKGAATALLAKLMEVAYTLMINTRTVWPQSSRKLNQVLQGLRKYLEAYGIAIEKKRYIKVSKIT